MTECVWSLWVQGFGAGWSSKPLLGLTLMIGCPRLNSFLSRNCVNGFTTHVFPSVLKRVFYYENEFDPKMKIGPPDI